MRHPFQRLILLTCYSLGAILLILRAQGPTPTASLAPSPRALALAILRNTDYVSVGPAGFAATIPAPILAWRTLVDDSEAPRLFKDLLETGTPSGQVYAMAGLFLVDPDAFAEGLSRLRSQLGPLPWQDGCVLESLTSEGIIVALQTGQLTHRLLAAAVVGHQ
jgi:hypothetical protein